MTQPHGRRAFMATLLAASASGCVSVDQAILDGIMNGPAGLSSQDVAMGLRAALDKGVGNALTNLGEPDGFLNDPAVRIPLPKSLQDIQPYLAPIGADRLLVELQEELNRGAEAAVPAAQEIFLGAVQDLTIDDAFAILRGSDRAATDYLQTNTSDELTALFMPIMENSLEKTGALSVLAQVDQQLGAIPFVSGLGSRARSDLIEHGVEFGLDGVFHFIAEEEKAIRANPAKRTSDILRRVFV